MKKMAVTLLLVFCLIFTGSAQARQTLYVYNWSEYMPNAVISLFEKETGIRVIYTTYDANETMYARIKLLDGKGYDLIFPSTYFVDKMRQEGLLMPLDKTRLPGMSNLDPSLLNKPYDPENRYSIPYLWGSTAIGVHAGMTDASGVSAFEDFWNPIYRGRVMLTNDMREVFGVALHVLGFSGNSTEESEIAAAYEKLRALMPSLRVFAAENQKQVLLSGEAVIGAIWNGEAYMAAEENPDIRYIYPKEGAVFWVDSMVIPKGAANPEAAHRFIDFVLRPEIARMITEEIGYATPNKAAKALLSPEVASNPTVYPDAELVETGEFQTDVGDAILIYQRYWERLKTGR
ncbi:extracellular solute-binding protein [Desulfobotulus sp. H1]|uniref:Extracellular solute-binding protein n=1 Tax=Desulfobotulus pelophilus TaxID=2823377 RepID=A0ABT3NBN4_9BACT|nr:extracellular solute-binding protein [Desulfobotulus pelophilus]MCW7754873.1 extracellular solute-binding protein [Desulfobotulus pelophilus]